MDLGVWKNSGKGAAETEVPSFVFLGRLVDWKGVHHLLRAFQSLTAHRAAQLIIIGNGDELENLKALSTSLGLADKVRFLGFVDQKEIPGIVRASRALVLPSLYECGGAVVLEAMALGKAAIATNWGGPADYLDPTCGILVEPVSVDGFVENLRAAMERLLDYPELAAEMGLHGRKKIEELYDWDKKIDLMVTHYRDVAVRAAKR